MNTSINIEADLTRVLAGKKRLWPQHVNRISSLDDPCLRRLYYKRHDWDKASAVEDGLQGVFETGKVLEPMIEGIVREVGMRGSPQWRIIGTQMPTKDRLFSTYQISGTIDGLFQVQDSEQPSGWRILGVVDIKTMSPNIYRVVRDYDSLSRYPWTRSYRGQLMLYALAHNLGNCYLLLVNKTNLYDMRIIEFPVDFAYCEGLLQKAQSVNEAIAAEEPPEGVDDPAACERCEFLSFCAPDFRTGRGMEFVDNDELCALLDTRAELEEAHKEYESLTRQIDAMLVKGKDWIVGEWYIKWKEITVKNKPQWRKTITKLRMTR